MVSMESQLVSFKQAKKLKELGFIQLFIDVGYYEDRKLYHTEDPYKEVNSLVAVAPSLDLVAKWLREEKRIPIYTEPYYPNNTLKWVCKAKYYMGKNNWSTSAFDTYEEALSAGIDKVLETL